MTCPPRMTGAGTPFGDEHAASEGDGDVLAEEFAESIVDMEDEVEDIPGSLEGERLVVTVRCLSIKALDGSSLFLTAERSSTKGR